MENFLFIVNPIAGGGKAKELIPQIRELMGESGKEFDVILTTRPKEAIELAEIYAEDFSRLVAVGGDGTVNEVAKGLINAKKGILGIVPGGTGNDMSKSLGIPPDINMSLDVILEGHTREIDVGIVNERYFLNIASVGFDAEVVNSVETIKKNIKGKFAYVLGVLRVLMKYKKRNITIEIDDKTLHINSVLLAVGNGRFYGGGMQILPTAKNDDGFLHICSVKDISNFKMLFLFPSIFNGKHVRFKKYVDIYKCRNVLIRDAGSVIINIDGELIINDKQDISFSLGDYKLEVIA